MSDTMSSPTAAPFPQREKCTFRAETELIAEAQRVARVQGITFSDVIRNGMVLYIAKAKQDARTARLVKELSKADSASALAS